jgi:glucose/arabinose dehydrogenase
LQTGWYTAEEINVLVPGANYGWPCYEGPGMAPDYSNFFAVRSAKRQNRCTPALGLPVSSLQQTPACVYLQTNNAMTYPAYCETAQTCLVIL